VKSKSPRARDLAALLEDMRQTVEQLQKIQTAEHIARCCALLRGEQDPGPAEMSLQATLNMLNEWRRQYAPAEPKPRSKPGPLPDKAVQLALDRLRDEAQGISLNRTAERTGKQRAQIRTAVRDHRLVAQWLLKMERRDVQNPGRFEGHPAFSEERTRELLRQEQQVKAEQLQQRDDPDIVAEVSSSRRGG
jgi:hypothetical protein